MKKLILLSLLLAGCVSPQERAARHAAYVDRLKYQCASYGFPSDSPQMAQCVMQLDAVKRQNDAINNAALLGYSQGLLQAGTPQPIGTRCYSTQTGPTTQQTVCH